MNITKWNLFIFYLFNKCLIQNSFSFKRYKINLFDLIIYDHFITVL